MAKKHEVVDVQESVDEVVTSNGEFQRVFSNENQTVISDLYLLKPTEGLQNIAWDPNYPDLQKYAHQHNFRTYDSNCREMTTSCSIGGHCHEVKIEVVDGKPIAKCSPPRIKYKNKMVAPNNYDNHTHEIIYVKSEKLKKRKMNSEAAKFMAAHDNPHKGR